MNTVIEHFRENYKQYGLMMEKYFETKELKYYFMAKDSLDCMLFSARQLRRER